MAVVNQSTYDAMKNIVDQKALWHNAKSTGQNPDQYKEAAKQYYNKLVNSGQQSIADQLNASDYEQAKKLLDSYVVEPVKAQNTGNTGGVKAPTPTVTEQANSLLPLFQSYVQPTPQQTAFQQQQQQNLQNLFHSYVNNQAQNQQKNNEIFTGLKAETEAAKKSYQDLYNRIFNTNYLDSDAAKTILESYGIRGDAASAAESAAGAAGNSGNIDSYSAANAKRQQLAYKNAGQQAALAAWDTQIARALETLKAMGVDVSGYYDRMQGNVDSNADYIKNLLDRYNEGTGALGEQLTAAQQDNAQYIAGLLGSLIDADTSRYQTDAEVGMQESVNKTNLSIAQMESNLAKYQAELSDKLARYEADKSAENAIELQKLSNEINRYMSDNELTANRESNTLSAQLQREANALEEKLARLEADEAYKRLVYQTENAGTVVDDLGGGDLDSLLGGDAVDGANNSGTVTSAQLALNAAYNMIVTNGSGTVAQRQAAFYDVVNDAITKGTITQYDFEAFIANKNNG